MPVRIKGKKRRTKGVHYNNLNDKFYKDNFIIPRDYISYRLKDVLKTRFYQQSLPKIVLEGLPNFKEKVEMPIKRVPLYSKLIEGHYEKDYANYDKDNTRVSIDFFRKNLPSFQKYKDQDELDWVIKDRRLLILEIFEYYARRDNDDEDDDPSLCTIEKRFNMMLRIIRIAYDHKKAPIYKLMSTLVFQIHHAFLEQDGKNKLNKYEAKKYINWEDVLYIQNLMQKTFDGMKDKNTRRAYDYNNDLLLISMYSLMPPLRNEIKFLEFTRNARKSDKDYIYINKNMTKIILKFNFVKKQHDPIYFDISKGGEYDNERLFNIIKQTYELYPRDYLFTLKNLYPDVSQKATQRAIDERMKAIFRKHGIKNQISVNPLRSSYISNVLNNNIEYNDKLDLVKKMRTSTVCMERSYRKIGGPAPILKKTACEEREGKRVKINDKASDASSGSSIDDDITDYDDDNSNNTQKKNIKKCVMKCFQKRKNTVLHDNNTNKRNDDNDDDDIDNDNDNDNDDGDNDNDDNDNDDGDNDDGDNDNDDDDNDNDNKRRRGEKGDKDIGYAMTQYKRKLAQSREWYNKNKEKAKEKAKKYKANMTPFQKTRERLMQLLNASPDYAEKMKKKTYAKYKFIYDQDSKRWTWQE